VSEEFVQHLTQTLTQNLTLTLSQGEGFKISKGEGFKISFSLGEGRDGVFLPRGEIEIKGKGRMKTYFLEKAK
jgi:hypothetical protein